MGSAKLVFETKCALQDHLVYYFWLAQEEPADEDDAADLMETAMDP